jgi:cation/acetate symporter
MAWLRPPQPDIGVGHRRFGGHLALLVPFAAFVLGVALLERLGIQAENVPQLVVAGALCVFAVAAFLAPGRRPSDFYAADRQVAARAGGAAMAGGVAGLLAIRLLSGVDSTSAEFIASAGGLTLGIVLFAIMIAPRLNRLGICTAGDLFARFGRGARVAGAAVAFVAAFLILVAHLRASGPLLSALLGIEPGHAVLLGAGMTALVVLPGGLRSLTAAQLLQYTLLILACLVPAVLLAARIGGTEAFSPQQLQATIREAGQALLPERAGAAALRLFLLAAGVASLPHLAARASAARSPRAAGATSGWAALFTLAFVAAGLALGHVLGAVAGVEGTGAFAGDLVQQALLVEALPSVVEGLLTAGLLAALFAIGQAALFAAASALGHDVWDEILDRKGPGGRRILVARAIVLAVAGAAVWAAALPVDIPLVAWALALAAAGSFAPLLLALWWRRADGRAVFWGVLSGFAVAFAPFVVATGLLPTAPGISPAVAAAFGVAIAFTVTVSMSILLPADSQEPARRPVAKAALPPRERPA